MARDEQYIKLINTQRWRRLRFKHLQSNPLCERCKNQDRVTAASEVHHIIPIESQTSSKDMEQVAYNPLNLMSVCRECHRAIHTEMRSNSKDNIKAANKRKAKRFVDKFL